MIALECMTAQMYIKKTCKESVNLVKLTDLKMNSLQYNYRGISILSEFGGITVYCKC